MTLARSKLALGCWPLLVSRFGACSGRDQPSVSRPLHIPTPNFVVPSRGLHAHTALILPFPRSALCVCFAGSHGLGMLLAQRHAGRVLSSMSPYSEVVCCVCTMDRLRRNPLVEGASSRSTRGRGRSRLVVGLARSDPYLCSANAVGELALRATTRPSSLAYALRAALAQDATPVGAILLALPMHGRPNRTPRHEQQRRVLARSLQRAWSGGTGPRGRVPLIAWDTRSRLFDASLQHRDNILWQGVGSLRGCGRPWAAAAVSTSGKLDMGSTRATAPSAGTQAAVALQCLLDAETGGWPNTFG